MMDNLSLPQDQMEPELKSEPAVLPFSPIVYYCKDCKKIVLVTEKKKMRFYCQICKKNNIAFGTERSIKNYYKVSLENPPA